ncbi:helix-turn-helix domain-containing protein [Actinomadura sp. BRA 177]|uniref:helix-turn-helix domain-containing protein n=1 Tax=Actinomadura sp. BRA 177 TaxID=2745202 RepID=UPI0020CDC284|nr:helix-turn-helix domain-containing protein [Actinomadura sp. BRA 177]
MQQLVDDYLDGSTVYQLGERFGVSRQTVSRLLKRHGVTMRMAGMSQEQIDEAARLYEAGQSLARIGAHLGFNDMTVRSRLIERGVKMRPRQGGKLSKRHEDNEFEN